MIHSSKQQSENLELEGLAELESSINLRDLASLKKLYDSIGDTVDKNSEAHLDDFTSNVDLISLGDISPSRCTAILKNTFDKYMDCSILEVERNTFYYSNTTTDWMLTKRSPITFNDVLVTPENNFVLLFDSEKSSGYRNIPSHSQFGVIGEGSYFVSRRKFKGKALQSEIFYLPLATA